MDLRVEMYRLAIFGCNNCIALKTDIPVKNLAENPRPVLLLSVTNLIQNVP